MLDKAIKTLNAKGYEQVGTDGVCVPHPSGLACWLLYVRRKPNPTAATSLREAQEVAHPAMIRQCRDGAGEYWVVQTLIVGDNYPI